LFPDIELSLPLLPDMLPELPDEEPLPDMLPLLVPEPVPPVEPLGLVGEPDVVPVVLLGMFGVLGVPVMPPADEPVLPEDMPPVVPLPEPVDPLVEPVDPPVGPVDPLVDPVDPLVEPVVPEFVPLRVPLVLPGIEGVLPGVLGLFASGPVRPWPCPWPELLPEPVDCATAKPPAIASDRAARDVATRVVVFVMLCSFVR
jgi:hypothetical protein